jgi:hypothetical protein
MKLRWAYYKANEMHELHSFFVNFVGRNFYLLFMSATMIELEE